MRIGLTGGIASGKSAVADELGRLGAVIIDADVLAREAVAPGSPALAEIVERFGADILTTSGALERGKLASIIFADPQARADLNAIVHPRVRELAAARRADLPPDKVAIEVIPLLVESGQPSNFDAIIVVDVDFETQLARLQARDGLSREQAEARIAAQSSREERLAVATWVLANHGRPEELQSAVRELWGRIVEFQQGSS